MAEPLVVGKALADMRQGSLEAILESAEVLASAYLKRPVSVLATHHDCIYVVAEGEDCIRRLGIKVEATGPRVVSSRVRDGLVTEANRDRQIAAMISEAAGLLAQGKPCNHLRTIAMLARKDGRYLFAEERDAVLATKAEPLHWEELYESARKEIRKAIYGGLREEEARVPKSRYGMLPPDRLDAFGKDVQESLASIFTLVQEVADALADLDAGSIVAHGWDAKKVLESMRLECKAILGSGRKAVELAEDRNLADLAVMHDRLADVTKALLIMRRFLSTSNSTIERE